MTTPTSTNKLNKSQVAKLSLMTTKSGKIRYLNSLGWSRSEIKNHLGIIYQHVRNVLEMSVKNPVDKI